MTTDHIHMLGGRGLAGEPQEWMEGALVARRKKITSKNKGDVLKKIESLFKLVLWFI